MTKLWSKIGQKHLGKLFLKKFKETNRPTTISWITMYNRMIKYNKENKGIDVPDDNDSENEDVIESTEESSSTQRQPSCAAKESNTPASATIKRKNNIQQSKSVTKKRQFKRRRRKIRKLNQSRTTRNSMNPFLLLSILWMRCKD